MRAVFEKRTPSPFVSDLSFGICKRSSGGDEKEEIWENSSGNKLFCVTCLLQYLMVPSKKHKEPQVIVFEDPEEKYRSRQREKKQDVKVELMNTLYFVERPQKEK